MKLKIDTSGLGESHWYEYLIRFIFGGAVTVLAGLVAKHYGPSIGGLFLAFPAILPATATLLQEREKEKKARAGQAGINRGRAAAGVDASGAAIGSIGLGVFGLIVWKGLPHSGTGVVLAVATLAWLATSVTIWIFREAWWRRTRRAMRASSSGSSPTTS